MHIQESVVEPSLEQLTSLDFKDAEKYVLSFPGWYIVYGHDRKLRRLIRRLLPRMFSGLALRKVFYKPYMAFNLTTGYAGCIACYRYFSEDVRNTFPGKETDVKKSTKYRMRRLAVKLSLISSLKKHEFHRNGFPNVGHNQTLAQYFPKSDAAGKSERGECKESVNSLKKQRELNINESIEFLKLQNLMSFILLLCTGFVIVHLGCQQIRMARQHGAKYPEKLDSPGFVRGVYAKASALVRHTLFNSINPPNEQARKI